MLAAFSTLSAALGLLGCFLWLRFTVSLAWNRKILQQLRELPAIEPAGGWPSLSVIFAARNEEAMVESATRSLTRQSYPDLEIVAVDDRSNDATGAILDRLAVEEPKLRVVHIETLPDGWLGKNHALQAASLASTADWLLFTDADILFEPLVLERAVAYAVKEELDHLVVAPDCVAHTVGERLFLTIFSLAFAMYARPWKVIDRNSKVALGVGAFNLVRASALRAVGGFERIKLSVDDDVRLGQMLKFCGYKPSIMPGHRAITVRWHVGMFGMIRGVEKNFFAAFDFKLWRVAYGVMGVLVLGVFPYVGLFVGPGWSRGVCLLSLILVGALFTGAKGQNGVTWWLIFFLPIGALAVAFALLRSTVLTLWQGGVRWRDHFYPLGALRNHVRNRNRWLDEVWKSTR